MGKEEDTLQVDYDANEEEAPLSKQEKSPAPTEKVPTTVYVEGFIQPFLVEEVKQLVSRKVAPMDMDNHFFMNVAKTNCYVTYPSMQEAMQALKDLKGKPFPEGFGNELYARITPLSAESMKQRYKSAVDREDDVAKRKHSENAHTVVALEDIFRKTRARPPIYYKPLTEAEREAKRIARKV